MSVPSLTVISIAGNAPRRTSRLIAALAGQSIASEIEVVIISVASDDNVEIACAEGLDVVVVRHPINSDWGRARAEGVRRARAPIVAFLEDHTVPVPDWAEQVRNGFATPPASTANNIAYRRDLIQGHFLYAQLFASRRLQHEQWSVLKRLAVTPIVPAVVPLLRLKRLFQALARRPQLRDAVAGLPVILALFISGALGEALGLLRGRRISAGSLVWFELEAERMARYVNRGPAPS